MQSCTSFCCFKIQTNKLFNIVLLKLFLKGYQFLWILWFLFQVIQDFLDGKNLCKTNERVRFENTTEQHHVFLHVEYLLKSDWKTQTKIIKVIIFYKYFFGNLNIILQFWNLHSSQWRSECIANMLKSSTKRRQIC